MGAMGQLPVLIIVDPKTKTNRLRVNSSAYIYRTETHETMINAVISNFVPTSVCGF